MHRNEMNQLLFEAAKKILEESAFALVDPAHEDFEISAEDSGQKAFSIDFAGSFSGSLLFIMPSSLSVSLASTMLGEEEGSALDDLKTDDAMGELANIICGNLLPLIAGPREEFSLMKPRAISAGEYLHQKSRADRLAAHASLYADECPVEIMVLIEEKEPVLFSRA
jgi:CheY-specific phosphatase CheX